MLSNAQPSQVNTSVDLAAARHVHFMGIKGVGMTALALCVQDLGLAVSGSDVVEDFVTADLLRVRNIPITDVAIANSLPPQTGCLIYTGAHQGVNNPQVLEAKKRGIPVLSQPQALAQVMRGKIGLSVCGVGGKTTTAAMLATIFDYTSLRPSFYIGVGKVLNLQVSGRVSSGAHFIAEADEYVVSPGVDNTPRFLFQTPQIIVCTNIAHDHPDAYSNLEDTKNAFMAFFDKLPNDGVLIANANSAPLKSLALGSKKVIWYGRTPQEGQWYIKDSFIGEGKQLVTIGGPSGDFNFTLSVPGIFNAQNALAAYLAARESGIAHQTIIEALQLFRGSMRRFEKVGEKDQVVFYDDYAHHPSQVLETLKAAKLWLPLKRLVVVFQPHTYSRTKVLLDQFAKAFGHAGDVIITDIYASAREASDPTINGQTVVDAIKSHQPNVQYIPRADLVTYLKSNLKPQDALFTLGAGDIYQIHQEMVN